MSLSLMETGILTQTMYKKLRQTYLKTSVFASSGLDNVAVVLAAAANTHVFNMILLVFLTLVSTN